MKEYYPHIKHTRSILPCGTISLKTGNFYGFLKGENCLNYWGEKSIFQLWRFGPSYKLVSSSGGMGDTINDGAEFHSDQSLRYLGFATLVHQFTPSLDELKKVKEIIKNNVVAIACYK